jgi:hypothetical protein
MMFLTMRWFLGALSVLKVVKLLVSGLKRASLFWVAAQMRPCLSSKMAETRSCGRLVGSPGC